MNWMDFKTYATNYSSWTYEAVLFAALGFVIGFFFRLFGKPFVYIFVGGVVAIVAMNSIGAVAINQAVIFKHLGLAGVTSLDSALIMLRSWALAHMAGVFFGSITFLIGWKMGA
ncbi:MAG: hypothetical protein UU47_C0002G0007 [candidate division TM6 bacterium GW2011_GWE2_41_16]|nr:MAG: hypothetical protein UU47_C0002G0007 [candidate division TM6 bacterium GW2011_GWE2_41_16]